MIANKVNLFSFTSNALFQLTTCERKAFKMLFEYFNEWLTQKVSTSQLLKYHLRTINSFYQETLLNFAEFLNEELIIPRHVVFSEKGLVSEVKYLSSTKYCELKMKLHDAFRSIKKIENIISCKNQISKKRILLPQHLADLFSIFYARTPILHND